jgi:hypothetical protein
MIRRAIDRGVSKESLARAFNVNLSSINLTGVSICFLAFAPKPLPCCETTSSPPM